MTAVAAAALGAVAPSANALGLGRLSVQSALGESLRAEIDITSLTAEEAGSLNVKVASPDAYKAAGVDYNSVLPATQTSLQRRADGRPFLRITSDRNVQEPFVDVILEMSWSSGRLVREYTMLFDPPAARAPASPPAVAAPAIAAAPPVAVAPAPAPRPTPAPRPIAEAPAARPAPPPAPATTPAPSAAAPAARTVAAPAAATASGEGGEYRVRAGDSLSRIASRTQKPGVSLDQMLVALYRGNPQAFIDNNMNRLKAGSVLAVPSADTARGTTPAEARQVIQAQSADFGAYRQRLASGVPTAPTEGNARQATGKVQAAVEDKKPASPTPDKLTLSKGAESAKASAPEAKLSKEQEAKASATRMAELSKNVEQLKKLQDATSASASKPAATPPAIAAAPAVPAPPPPAPAPAPVPPPPPPAPPPPPPPAPAPVAAAPASVPAPTIVAAAPPPAPEPAPAPASAAAPPPAPKPAAAPPASAPAATAASDEPGFIASLLDNPLVLSIGGVLVALLAGLGFYRLSSKRKRDSGETSFLESRLQPDSFFGASGGQRIDTRDAGGASSSMSYSLSQLDAIGDVDPVAEADVYLAYGRDLQAEEILKEAMRANPERLAVRTKLLEVYAKRRDAKGFELLATQLFSLTRGEGEDWAKAQELGLQIDPENSLYQPGGRPEARPGADGESMIEPLGASTMPQSVLPTPSKFQPTAEPPASSFGLDLDLDLDMGDHHAAPPRAPEVTQPFGNDVRTESHGLDFDLSDEPAPPRAPAVPTRPAPMDFNLDDMKFEDSLPSQAPNSTFGLDDGADDPLARKLELAEEFRQIGDMEGARDLLQEVVAKAEGALKGRAQSMLDDIS